MNPEQRQKAVRHFSKHLFLVGRVFVERNKARRDLEQFIEKMKDSIIRMRLSYTDVERLKKKIDITLALERKFGRFYRGEDKEDLELKRRIVELEEQLATEREEKTRTKMDKEEDIKQLKASLENVKSHMKYLLLEKAKKHQRMKELEKKISGRVAAKN